VTAPITPGETKALDAEVFLIAWLKPLVAGALANTSIGTDRTSSMPLPYRMVNRVTGIRTVDADYPVMWVHTFATKRSDAAREAGLTDDRMQRLVEYPGWDTVLPDGRVAQCDWAEISEAAHWEAYAAESVINRFVSEYKLCLSFVTP
jgi:hypothetical protein